MSLGPIHHDGSIESTAAATSHTDLTAALIELVAGGAYARVGAKGAGSVGTKLSTVLSGVVKDALIAAANGDLTTLGALVVAGALTPQALLDISGASAGQIKFPASQNASSDANTLDDYEEGTWTPVVTFGGGSTGVTYGVQVGHYTKVGRLVFLNGRIILTSKGSSTGTVSVTGLPFSGTEANAGSVGYYQGVSGAGMLGMYLVNASSFNMTYASATLSNDLDNTLCTNSFGMYFSFVYRV